MLVERDWHAGWGDADEIGVVEIDQMYRCTPGEVNPHRRHPRFMLHLSKTDPAVILAEGLRVDVKRGFRPNEESGFNLPGVYMYDALATTRRLFGRSHANLFVIDTFGLEIVQDAHGGQGAWRCDTSIEPARIQHVHTYVPWERPFPSQYLLGAGARPYQRSERDIPAKRRRDHARL
jgi:hypothetical protein